MTSTEEESYTPPQNKREKSPVKGMLIDIPEVYRNVNKICLLVDRPLTNEQLKIISEYYSLYEITKDDSKKSMGLIPLCQCYVIPLINNVCYPSKSWGSLLFARSRQWFKQNSYTVIYYKTLNLFDKEEIKSDYLITTFPDNVVSKHDLFDKLAYNSIPEHIGFCGLIINCIFSRITIADCCFMSLDCIKFL